MDRACHRRRKAVAKAQVRLDFQSLLPSFVLVGSAAESDAGRSREVCAGLKAGEIVVFDRAYVDLKHLGDRSEREVVWVTRWKAGMTATLLEEREVPAGGRILKDYWVKLSDGQWIRRIRALVEVDGQEGEMMFLTNQLKWAASTVVALYQARWQVEVFLEQQKQTLKLWDLLVYSANAIRWQAWTALLVHLRMR